MYIGWPANAFISHATKSSTIDRIETNTLQENNLRAYIALNIHVKLDNITRSTGVPAALTSNAEGALRERA
jgi:hypothetical protein